MKKGEKVALWFVAVAFTAIIALTVSLESQNRQNQGGGDNRSASNPAATIVNTIPAGMNPDDLPDPSSKGAITLAIFCVQCHDLPTPAMHTAKEWDDVITRMLDHMQARRGGMLSRLAMPAEHDWQELRNYLAEHAQRPIVAQDYADLESAPGKLFMSTCSQCHAAPDPQLHSAKEWPRVIVRMKANMRNAGKTLPDDESTAQITAFLQKHAM